MGDMADDLYDKALEAQIAYEYCVDWKKSFEKELELRKEGKHIEAIWESQNGDIEVKNMTDKHILNCIKMLKRVVEE